MKVVINRCFGGFGLSPLALYEYAKRKGKSIYFYKQTGYSSDGGQSEYTRMDLEAKDVPVDMFVYRFTQDFGPVVKGDVVNVCEEDVWIYSSNIPRDDKDLVQVVEELGDKANCSCARLVVVEIPDGIEWTISNYDGQERVEEAHRSW